MSKLFSPTIKKLLITVVSQGIILGLSVITGFVLPSKMGPEISVTGRFIYFILPTLIFSDLALTTVSRCSTAAFTMMTCHLHDCVQVCVRYIYIRRLYAF